MVEIQNPSMLDNLQSILNVFDRCWNPSWNDDQTTQHRNENGGDGLKTARTPSTDENDSVLSNPNNMVLPYEDDAELVLSDLKKPKIEEKQCNMLCFDCKEKNDRSGIKFCNNMPQNRKKQVQNVKITNSSNNRKLSIDSDRIIDVASNKTQYTKQDSIERKDNKINARKIPKLDDSKKVDSIFRNRKKPSKEEIKKLKNHTTTNWKHVFWNNYFRNNTLPSQKQKEAINMPFDTLSIPPEFKRTDISELTMKSSHAHYHYHNSITSTALLDSKKMYVNNRVMAYYAIGQHYPKHDCNGKF